MFILRFKSLISNHHDLKKNGYKILKKLHKLEKRTNLGAIYSCSCPEGYFFILACKNLADILTQQYGCYEKPYIQSFLKRTEQFVTYLDIVARKQARINPGQLSSYLSSYTEFFNRINKDHIVFVVDKNMLDKWNIGCIMAYTAVWGNR